MTTEITPPASDCAPASRAETRGRVQAIVDGYRRLPSPVREVTTSVVAYGAPTLPLSQFLTKLNDGVLWLPSDWRGTALLTGLAIGLVAFHLARVQFKSTARSVERARRIAIGKRAFAWYGVTVVLIAGYTGLRIACAHPWEPPEKVVVGLFSDEHPEAPSTESFDPSDIAAPVYLEAKGPPYRGHFLFPFGFPRSTEALRLGRQLHYAYETGDATASEAGFPRELALTKQPSRLIDAIRQGERTGMWITIVALFTLHVATLVAASVAYGYSVSVVRDFTTEMAKAR